MRRTLSVPRLGVRLTGYWMALLAAATLVACGGASEPDAEPAERQETALNVVADATSAELATSGDFKRSVEYLAKSPHVLRSSGGGSARFSLQPPRSGQYEVFVWWPQNLADAGDVDFTVEHRGGRHTVRKSQLSGGGHWQSIGSYGFDSNRAAVIEIRGTDGVPLYVDAVRLQFTGARVAALAFEADKLPIGLKDEPYSAHLEMTGGVPPYSFSLAGGELPPGLTLDSDTGEISGQPARSGEFSVTVSSRDAHARVSRQTYTLIIDESAGSASKAQGMPPRAGSPDKARQSITSADVPDVSALLTIVAGMAEGEWRRVNLNNYSSVWTPADLRPLFGRGNPDPSKIILAWSSFAWDPNRAALLLYGGGHANYRGNDVYLWRASTQKWERAALPSEMVQNALGHWNAIDGVDKAPASAHTYDNTIFLPLLDRMLALGGAADANGGHYLTQATSTAARNTGPYLFDPARAHPDKVGGSTGSHVRRVAPYSEVVGGNMWSNRESWLNASTASTPPTEVLSNGCTGYAVENGRDVVYVRSASRLYRYAINDLSNPAADTWTRVGRYYYGGSGGQGTCAYDPVRKIFVSTHATQPFIFWNLATPGYDNRDTLVTPTDPSGEFPALLSSGSINLTKCALEFDPVRNNFRLWCGDGRVWTLTPPATPSASGWTIVKATTPVGSVPTESVGTGILGKWKYVSNLDVFMGLADSVLGNVWVYKPVGWVNPAGDANLPPSVSISAPADGARFTVGSDITISASAADGDGSVAKVEFFADANKIGESLSAPFGMVWSGSPEGVHVLTAVATDDRGATRTSEPISVTVDPVTQTNEPPTVNMVQPADGSTVPYGTPVTLEATANDSDGTVVRVQFRSGDSTIGEATVPPFTAVWMSPPLGTSVITAVATDDGGATTTSAPHSITVTSSSGEGGTVTLQRGTTPGAIVSDTYLSSYHKTLNFGAGASVQDQYGHYPSLMRFAIFQSEGGPVPNGSQITSVVLSLYKYSSYDMTYAVHRVLNDWSESGATWNVRMSGVPWTVAGGAGMGSDIDSVADATAATDFNPGWINFDVTASVQRMSTASQVNFGWRLRGVTGNVSGLKKFHASEFTSTPSLRPKLVIIYQ